MSNKGDRYHIGLKGQSAELMEAFTENGYKAKDIFFDALALYDFVIRETAAGKQFGALSEDGQSMNTVITPILQSLKKNPQWLREYSGIEVTPGPVFAEASTTRKHHTSSDNVDSFTDTSITEDADG